ncbi:MAG: hypothetical protein EKK41_02275 [Hyphomicrobiales bacterium]|nr:MAG: hypothetical protein EKK41_02275 [Hyphomicrobiales bacterium]
MPFGGRLWRAASVAGALACCLMPSAPAALAADNAAHQLADKFAGDGAQGQSPEERRKAEEARKKEAERQAQEALREAARKRAEAALKADRDKQKGAVKPSTSPAKETADPKAEEDDMLTRARLEEEARLAAERVRTEEEARRKLEAILNDPDAPTAEQIAARNAELRAKEIAQVRRVWQTANARIAEAARKETEAKAIAQAEAARKEEEEKARLKATRKEAEAKAIADAKAAAEREKVVARARHAYTLAQARLIDAANREAETKALAAAAEARARVVAQARRTAQAAQQRIEVAARLEAEERARTLAAKPASAPEVAVAMPLPPPASPQIETGSPQAVADARPLEGRVTILLVMSPGTKGIRRHNKTADPILCLNDGCYLSEGPDAPARFLPRQRALGFSGTFGERAAACRNQLGCVFRGIDVTEVPLIVQPIDMHVIKHDRRRIQAIEKDSQCRTEGARLVCLRGIYAEDYAMWVVPEKLAREVGPAVLERTLAEGLNGPRSAGLDRPRY